VPLTGDARSAPGAITGCSSSGGNFGSTAGTATIIEYNYKIISASVSLRGYELGQLESAMIDAIIPSLFPNSCARRKLEESPLHRQRHLEMAGLSAAPNDIVSNVEGSCQQQDTSDPNRNCATAVLGRKTIYGDDVDTLTATIRNTLCAKMAGDVFNGSYTSTTEFETIDYTILKSECVPDSPPPATTLETEVIVEPLNPTNFVIVGFAAVFAAFLIYAYGRWRRTRKLSSSSNFGHHLDDSDISDSSSYDNDSLASVCGPPAMDLRSIHDNRVVDDSPVRISTIARNSHFPETIQECWAEEDECLEDSGEVSRFGLCDSADDMETVFM